MEGVLAVVAPKFRCAEVTTADSWLSSEPLPRTTLADTGDAVNYAARARIRVLIVDDHELVRVGLRTLLSTDPQIEVLGEATAGAQAIAMAREKQPDVVLLDAHLPDLSGPDVCRRLRAAVPALGVPPP